MKTKELFVGIAIVIISCFIGLALCELGARIVVDPVDYLSPTMVRDGILGIRLPPRASGHDQWGFRNKAVIESPDIVTLGDSHTYGNTAKMLESWPSVLARVTGKRVYNLGLGGYGPNQYYYLFKTKALNLKPKVIICGLYMGDDFDNAYEITYGLQYWKYLREPGIPELKDWDIWEKESDIGWHKHARNWLSKNSVIYRITVHGIFAGFKGNFQIKHSSDLYKDTSSLVIEEKGIREAFRPKGVLRGLDQSNPRVREGMRVTLRLLKEMSDACRPMGIRFVVAVIPTKESVFAGYIEHNTKIRMSGTIDEVIENERRAKKSLFAFFNDSKMEYVDLTEPMRRGIERKGLYAPSAVDMHPNANGYRTIAEALAAYLKANNN